MASSRRFDGLISRCRTPAAVGVLQSVGHLGADPRDFAKVPQLARGRPVTMIRGVESHPETAAIVASAFGSRIASPRGRWVDRRARALGRDARRRGRVAAAKRPVRSPLTAADGRDRGGRCRRVKIASGSSASIGVRRRPPRSRRMSSKHTVQRLTLDELHGVVADAFLLAVVEDADDVGVVQPGRQRGPRRGTAAGISSQPGIVGA